LLLISDNYQNGWVDVRSPTPARVPHPVSCNVNNAYSFITALLISLILYDLDQEGLTSNMRKRSRRERK
jgi:hypothetical protein